MIVNPAIASTSVAQVAQDVGLIKVANGVVKRLEGMPDGRGNAVFEAALKNRDIKALKQFSVSAWQIFLGTAKRLGITEQPTGNVAITTPPQLWSMDSLEEWYTKASWDDNEAVALGVNIEGKVLSKVQSIYDDSAVINALQFHAGNKKGAEKYWNAIKGTATSYYQQLTK
jgi:hypothetical protein